MKAGVIMSKKRCLSCIWKDGMEVEGWCYMFLDYMPNCAKFKAQPGNSWALCEDCFGLNFFKDNPDDRLTNHSSGSEKDRSA